MKTNRVNERLNEITANTLIVGIDIAKNKHWARFVDCRGLEVGKAIAFTNDIIGFKAIISKIKEICNSKTAQYSFDKVVAGMEPTGHYWKALASYLDKQPDIKVVGVNPYHTKKAKELDDNSPTKSDKKDAITIARLVKDGRFFEPYLPDGVYGELRVLVTTRISLMSRLNAIKNTITAVLDEYFPEITTVFKYPLRGKASRHILKVCPFPSYILKLGVEGVLAEIKKAVKKTVGLKKAKELVEKAEQSIGVKEGLSAAKLKLTLMMSELECLENELVAIEESMEERLCETGYAEKILAIKGIGVVSAASFLGEIGDPKRFANARQISNLAGYNLVEDSSGKNKSGTAISKRGRKNLRSILYKMAFVCVTKNTELKRLYQYLKTRAVNPLKKKQALIVISKKIITIIHTIIKKDIDYCADKVIGKVRQQLMAA